MDVFSYNKEAWNKEVAKGNPWTIPATPEMITEARRGVLHLLLTPTRFVPGDWLGDVQGKNILCLASGGGQQGPLLAAAGANVTVFDQSPAQLAQDRFVADRESLKIQLVEGNMQDLSCFEDGFFDLIFHPVSNCFTPDVLAVWNEAHRVLKQSGKLLAGFCNPVKYIFDFDLLDKGQLVVQNRLPYSDLADMQPDSLKKYVDEGFPLEFSHTLTDLLGGQIQAGFNICGFYEDVDPTSLLSTYFPEFYATLAIKL